MKLRSAFKSGAIALAVGLAPALHAITITYAEYGVGEWTPASAFNGDPVLIFGVQRVVDVWNGDASAGAYSIGGPNSAIFTKGSGTEVPTTLIGPDAYVSRANAGSFTGLDNSSGEFTFLTAKYGNSTQRVFYIGNILDTIFVPDDLGSGAGLSHIAWLRGKPSSSTSVPDGGFTLALLGSALLMIVAFRRRFTS